MTKTRYVYAVVAAVAVAAILLTTRSVVRATATTSVAGRVTSYLLDDQAQVNGLLLDGGSQVRFSPDMGKAVVQRIKTGDTVSVVGLAGTRSSFGQEVRASRITVNADTIIETAARPEPGRGGPGRGGPPAPRGPGRGAGPDGAPGRGPGPQPAGRGPLPDGGPGRGPGPDGGPGRGPGPEPAGRGPLHGPGPGPAAEGQPPVPPTPLAPEVQPPAADQPAAGAPAAPPAPAAADTAPLPPAPVPPPPASQPVAIEVDGAIKALLVNGRGDVSGLLLSTNDEVHLGPEVGLQLAALSTPVGATAHVAGSSVKGAYGRAIRATSLTVSRAR